MWDAHFFFAKKPREKQQPTPVWLEMAFCCPQALILLSLLLSEQIAARHAALARVLLPLQPGAQPWGLSLSPSLQLLTVSQPQGHNPSSGSLSRLPGLQEGFISPCKASLTLPGAAGGFPAGAGMVTPQLPLTAQLLQTHPARSCGSQSQ